ncbi:hypothetical protein B296_00055409 [Ensete ventricosum]|uniref:Uncharacterized protein n=1 Tax=Ensete ventricosum TaxID=4639 RepID=A0A426X6F9_ENSVE|nr:hypothetical protein B296_00055409 [Ensete ventricosum]
MDAWAPNLKSGGGLSVFGATRKHSKVGLLAPWWATAGWRVVCSEGALSGAIDVRVSLRRQSSLASGYRSVVVKASGKKKNGRGDLSSSGKSLRFSLVFPEEDGHDGNIPQYNKSKFNDSAKSNRTLSDWRDFRANLVAWEQEQEVDSGALLKVTASNEQSQRLGLKWAHPIPVPETGCVLIATEKLDGVPNFERTVVLLLRSGSRDPREGPFGIILNRSLHRKIKHMKSSNPDLATIFADCSVHFGGPLEANMFLVRSDDSLRLPGFEEVVSGVRFGARNRLDEAAALVKKGVFRPEDFRFFVGYAGWQSDQLLDEIESDYWVVAACSSHLIDGATLDSSSDLWEEILQLMGGQYSDLSRKPKQDDY